MKTKTEQFKTEKSTELLTFFRIKRTPEVQPFPNF